MNEQETRTTFAGCAETFSQGFTAYITCECGEQAEGKHMKEGQARLLAAYDAMKAGWMLKRGGMISYPLCPICKHDKEKR